MKGLKAPIDTCSPLVDELFFIGNEISDETLSQILALPRNELILDLERSLNFAIDNFEEVLLWDNDDFDRTSFALHAVFLLTQLKSEQSFPLLLKLSQCNDELLEFYFGDYPTECFWQDALVLGNNHVAASVQFFKEGGSGFLGNCIMSAGLVQVYLHYPEKQEEIIAAFNDLLDFLFDKNPDDDNLELNEVILNAVADLRNPDLLLSCKRFYDDDRTRTQMTSDWKEFEETIFSNYSEQRQFLSLRERYDYFENMRKNFENKFAEESQTFQPDFLDAFFSKQDQPLLPINSEPKIQRNEPCPCGSGLKYKKCCLNKGA